MQFQSTFIYLLLFSFFLSGVIQEIWCYLITQTNIRKLVTDFPNNRSSHNVPTSRGGGALFVLFAIFSFSFLSSQNFLFWYLSILCSVTSIIISLAGLLDDIKGLTARKRFYIQLFCVLLNSIFFFIYFRAIGIEFIVFIIIIFWFIYSLSLINFYNFADGINGHASLQFLISASTMMFYIYSITLSKEIYLQSFLILFFPIFGGILFFLKNNLLKKNIFMGDSGSTFLGFFLSIIFIFCSFFLFNEQATSHSVNNFTPIYILLTWIFFSHIIFLDCACMIIAKIISNTSISKAHKIHIYQIVSRKKGFSHFKTTILFSLIQLLLNILFIILIRYMNIIHFFIIVFLYLSIISFLLTKYHINSLKVQNQTII